MRKHLYPFMLCLSVLLLVSCRDEEEVVPEPEIRNIDLSSSSLRQGESMEINVLIEKPTPCHYVDRVNLNISGNTYNYDILLEREEGVCAQVIEEERVQVLFNPQEAGEYTLNFLINGRQKLSRQLQVNE